MNIINIDQVILVIKEKQEVITCKSYSITIDIYRQDGGEA